MTNQIALVFAFSISMLVAAGMASAHEGATGVVKERMDGMADVGKSMKALGKMMRGQEAYNVASVRDHAKTIAGHGGDNLTKLFPEGSLDHPTEALPKIWQDWDGFSRLAKQLADQAEALGQAADNERAGPAGANMMGQGGMMGVMDNGSSPSVEQLAKMSPDAAFMHLAQTCASCHQDYRKKKQ